MRLKKLIKHAKNVKNPHDAITFAMMANSAAIELATNDTPKGNFAESTLKRANQVLADLLSAIETGDVEV